MLYPLIHYRFGKHYELPLLLQSFVMILVMFAMLHICTLVSRKKTTLVVKRITGEPLYTIHVNMSLYPHPLVNPYTRYM